MKFIKASAVALSGVLLSSSALAGGFQLSEYSTTNLGRAFAGIGIVGDDYSAVAFNPAGMAMKGDGLQLGVNLMRMASSAEGVLNGNSQEKGKLETLAAVPHFFAQKKIGEDFRLGVGVFVPYGFSLKYNDDWFGRTHALNSDIAVMDLSIAASYNIMKELTVGASVLVERADAELTNAAMAGMISDLSADSYAIGYQLGIMYRPFEDTRFGISYRSRTDHDLEGDHKLGPLSGNADAELSMPAYVAASAYQKVGNFGLAASVKWSEWSSFDVLDIYSDIMGPRALVQHVEEDWKDTWMFSFGVDYYYNENWTFRAGIAYDETGIRDDEHRTARIPDSDRIIASLGVGYKNANWSIDLGYAHMFMKHVTSNHAIPGSGTLHADYDPSIDLLGLSVQYNF